jgi:coniferyl-aldehyde dehydrogenase
MTDTQSPATHPHLHALLSRQREAYRQDPVPSEQTRRQWLQALRRFVLDNREALCKAIAQDYGHRSRHESLLTEVMPALKEIDHALSHLRTWMAPRRRSVDRIAFGLARNEVIPQPLGVVGVIVPWNFPVNLSFAPLAAILAAGNRAMVKMSENSRALAALLIEKMPAYLPPETVAFIDESGGVGPVFSQLPFDHLLFTGSAQTGRAVMAAAARNLVPVTLELGGRSPALVCADFDLRTAAERILFTKCLNAGQICTTVDHVFVPRARVNDFVALAQRIVPARYPSLDSPDYTSIISAQAYDRLVNTLDEAQARGAQVIPLLPGPARDAARHRLAPHLVIGAPADCTLMQREIFGPILPVLPYDEIWQVVDTINAGPRPLAFYPFTHDSALLDRLLAQVMSGGVSVNDALFHVAQTDLPFGGVGESGMGHYHGREGFETFSKMRPVFRQSRWATTGLLSPPYGQRVEQLIRWLMPRG